MVWMLSKRRGMMMMVVKSPFESAVTQQEGWIIKTAPLLYPAPSDPAYTCRERRKNLFHFLYHLTHYSHSFSISFSLRFFLSSSSYHFHFAICLIGFYYNSGQFPNETKTVWHRLLKRSHSHQKRFSPQELKA